MSKRYERQESIPRVYRAADFLTIKCSKYFRAAEARSGHSGIASANINAGVVNDLTNDLFNFDLLPGTCTILAVHCKSTVFLAVTQLLFVYG